MRIRAEKKGTLPFKLSPSFISFRLSNILVSAPKFSIPVTLHSNPEELRVTPSGRVSRSFTIDKILNKPSQQNTRTFHRFHFFDYINCMIVSTLFNTQSERRSVMKTYEKLED